MFSAGNRRRVVMLGDFFSQRAALLNLFYEKAPPANSEALMSLMDKLNQHGRGHTILRGRVCNSRGR